ncbi:hypothetical protein C5C74_05165 [Rathayibacter sp. AY1E8]|uniref:antiviral reverse transcriptase Drt3b n=1 Tax=Rathayibacter sp. AY1E8 TaxID=2080555 RepID=UPI000CE89108|nr:antiviral reverse transcriptase Drt3b [Rathayibacter sp. AY1E8]PPG19870.1 hypothetical protein C5C74_05165 [Rathayibacter sp. AY1E8]
MPKNSNRYKIRHKPMRAVLSEFLPYELPAGFSNAGFYAFLTQHHATFVGKDLYIRNEPGVEELLRLALGPRISWMPEINQRGKWFRVTPKMLDVKTVPYRFRIRHGEQDFRDLSLPHPRTQLAFVRFYDEYRSLITHFGQLSSYSLRKPVEEARVTVVRDDLFAKKIEREKFGVESKRHEYSKLRSFFRYDLYSNIHSFYDSPEFVESEKKYSKLLRLDVSKCFDSIYTHSLEWAVYGRDNVKSNRTAFKGTFPSRFDALMRAMNEDETNGILIGPEVSRIFAELILQRIDRDVEAQLESEGLLAGRDYSGYRYVDDFFFFFNDSSTGASVNEAVRTCLRRYKLHIQESKIENVVTPYLTPLSLAKVEVRSLLSSSELNPQPVACCGEGAQGWLIPSSATAFRQLIPSYKSILSRTAVRPRELANYALVQVEEALERFASPLILSEETKLTPEGRSERDSFILDRFSAAIEFAFFIYSGSGLASAAVKVARISAFTLKAARSIEMSVDRQEYLRQTLYSEVMLQMVRYPMAQNAMIEGLYLLDLLGELGEGYAVPEASLMSFLGVAHPDTNFAEVPEWFHATAAMTVIRYIKDGPDYRRLRGLVDKWILVRLEELLREEDDNAERAVLALDVMSSPYFDEAFKRRILELHGAKSTRAAVTAVERVGPQWFTDWTKKDLHSHLLDKRSQQVY